MSMLMSSLDLVAQIPDPGKGVAPPGSDKVLKIMQWIMYLAAAACVVGFIYAGAKMAYERNHHGGGAESTGRLIAVAIGCVVIGSASALVGALL